MIKLIAASAFAAALTLPISASAVYVSPEGQGQALIYPYYTAQSLDGQPFQTMISIVNHSGAGKSLRVRLREGRNGRSVLSFNLYLSARDTWTGAVIPGGEGASLVTADASCTSPQLAPSNALSPSSFQGANADPYGSEAGRVREGYVEVLEMASLRIADGTPNAPTCEQYRASDLSWWLQRPSGGLTGTLTLINVANGMDFTVAADALADLATAPFHRPPGDEYPDFDALEIGRHSAFLRDGWLYRMTWSTGVQAVEAALMQGAVANEVVLDTATRSATDWILTFPTRRFHGSYMRVLPFLFGNEERRIPLSFDFTPRDGSTMHFNIDFPANPPSINNVNASLPWDATVVSFRRAETASGGAGISSVLGARNGWRIDLPTSAENGSVRINLSGNLGMNGSRMRSSDGAVVAETGTLMGLPVVGFMVRTFRNDTVACNAGTCQANYGGAFPHRYERHLYPPPAPN